MGNKLSPRKLKGVTALLNCSTVEAAAQSIGVGVRTMRRWLGEPQFVEELRKSQEELLHLASRRFMSQIELSAATICELRDDPDVSVSVRLRSAQSIIDYSLKFFEQTNLVDRILEMEGYFDEIIEQ